MPRLEPRLSRLPGITGGFSPSTRLCSGVIGGATSIFAPSLIMYLTALQLPVAPLGSLPQATYQVP